MSAEDLHINNEQENRRRGLVSSIVVHALLILLLLIPFIHFPIPPPGQQGILVSLGLEEGSGDDRPDTQNEEQVQPTPAAAQQQPQPEVRQVAEAAPATDRDIQTVDDAEALAIKKAQEREALRKREQELERQRQLEIERKKAEEEARKQAEFDKNKKQFSDLLSGSGKGNTNTQGNQGNPTGDPDASALEGISTGSGKVGGGLGSRGVVYEPQIEDTSQKIGKVVVQVCVDQAGNVISAQYTQRGSTTTDSDLRRLAEQSARQFKFSESEIERQCGTITIDFKVQ